MDTVDIIGIGLGGHHILIWAVTIVSLDSIIITYSASSE